MIAFLKNKQKAFWTLQILGWLGYGFVRMFNGLANGRSLEYVKPSIVAMITGFLLTLIMRGVYQQIRNRSLPVVTFIAILMTGFLSLVFSTIEVIGHVQLYDPFWSPRGIEFFSNAMFDTYVLLTWTALYFIIHYYLLLEAETRKALEAAAQAQKAQINMLRYQLNPHFLFNTLNAISTLVLDKDTKAASGMLNRLSKFLRYTLVHQSTQKMSVEKEVEALKLYLDIEKVRFGDRLNIIWNVDDAARLALVPSLILQPIIENAIKHAIAKKENGGTIEVSAQEEISQGASMLSLNVCDDGYGLPEGEVEVNEQSAGVGLQNTRERLKQLYGDGFVFELENNQPSGLLVTIKIPLELD
jgi:signal transduction histidine kinase